MPGANNYREAIKEKANVISMTSAVALSIATFNPLPLLVGLVAETAYLLLVPDSRWYRFILSKREREEQERKRQQMRQEVLPTLSADLRERYMRLEQMCNQINTQSADGRQWFAEAPRKFDYLLDKFLVFASKQTQFTHYLASVHEEVCGSRAFTQRRPDASTRPPQPRGGRTMGNTGVAPGAAAPMDPGDPRVLQIISDIQQKYEQELAELTALLGKEQDASTRAVLEKRQEILKRRAEFLAKMAKTLTNLTHQLQLLEDTFGLINDELRARSPEQVLEDIDDVITQTDSMTKVLEELAPYEQMVSRMEQSIQS